MSLRPDVVWVGADGALGKALASALGARPVSLRCPDFADDRTVAELAQADVVIDAAGPRVHPELNWGDYLREHMGTAGRVAHSMRPGSHLVLISSAAVYGSARGHVTAMTPPEPETFPVPAYAWGKLAAEHAARAVCAERNIALTILRPSIIYGPGAGGVFIKLRDLARRGVRFALKPESTAQHLLHLRLFQRVLEALVSQTAPVRTTTLVVADPFVLTTADVNSALAASAPRAATVPMPLGGLARALRGWQRRAQSQAPGPVSVAAMLMLDNVYDWETCLTQLGVDPAPFGQIVFDNFLTE